MPSYIAYNKTDGTINSQGCSVNPSLQITEDEDYLLSEHEVIGYRVDVETKQLIPCEVETTVMDVIASVYKTDEEFNKVIAKITSNVLLWREQNYSILRYNTYPAMIDFIDAQVKLSSTDPDIVISGQEQMNKYLADSLAVKERFPKPVV